jgi:hypothetical protein
MIVRPAAITGATLLAEALGRRTTTGKRMQGMCVSRRSIQHKRPTSARRVGRGGSAGRGQSRSPMLAEVARRPRRGQAVLLRQAPPPRDEPASHRQPQGDILWVSGPLPGAVHDLTAARIWGIVRELAAAGLIVLADKGYHGVGDHIRTSCTGKNKPESQKAANRAHATLRSPGERANAQLKTWRILRKLRCCPWRAGQLAKAIHVLQARELQTRVIRG